MAEKRPASTDEQDASEELAARCGDGGTAPPKRARCGGRASGDSPSSEGEPARRRPSLRERIALSFRERVAGDLRELRARAFAMSRAAPGTRETLLGLLPLEVRTALLERYLEPGMAYYWAHSLPRDLALAVDKYTFARSIGEIARLAMTHGRVWLIEWIGERAGGRWLGERAGGGWLDEELFRLDDPELHWLAVERAAASKHKDMLVWIHRHLGHYGDASYDDAAVFAGDDFLREALLVGVARSGCAELLQWALLALLDRRDYRWNLGVSAWRRGMLAAVESGSTSMMRALAERWCLECDREGSRVSFGIACYEAAIRANRIDVLLWLETHDEHDPIATDAAGLTSYQQRHQLRDAAISYGGTAVLTPFLRPYNRRTRRIVLQEDAASELFSQGEFECLLEKIALYGHEAEMLVDWLVDLAIERPLTLHDGKHHIEVWHAACGALASRGLGGALETLLGAFEKITRAVVFRSTRRRRLRQRSAVAEEASSATHELEHDDTVLAADSVLRCIAREAAVAALRVGRLEVAKRLLRGGWLGIDALAELRREGLPSYDYYCKSAGDFGELREALLEHGLQLSNETVVRAAKHGRLDILSWLRDCAGVFSVRADPAGMPSPLLAESAITIAAERGHLDVIRFLRALDPPCPWSSDACAKAAYNDHLEVLRWLRSQDPPCPWTAHDIYLRTLENSGVGNRTIEWAAKHGGCPYPGGVMDRSTVLMVEPDSAELATPLVRTERPW